jgi:DNA modification methylase
MKAMEFHEVCNIFPPMGDDEFRALVADIRANGLREPVWTHDGKVIDGRNRIRACQEIGILPATQEWNGQGSLVAFVVSLNLHRRHLSSGQKAACGTEVEERLAVEAKERQREAARRGGENSGRVRRGEIEPGLQRIPQAPVPRTKVVEFVPQPSIPKARDEAAKLVGSNPRYIQDAKAVKAAAPELHEKVKAGKITLPQAKREVQRQEKRIELAAKAEVIISNGHPPWEVVEGDCIERLSAIKPGSVRLVFADPPYNIGVEYGDHHDDNRSDEDFIDWCRLWIDTAIKTLADDGSIWVLINDEYADYFGMLLRDAGVYRRAWIKWYESFGVNCSNNFNRCSRHLFYCVKDRRRFVFNRDAVVRASDRQAKYGDSRADPGGKVWDDIWGINPPIPRLVGNAAERMPDFPTQLPLALLTPIIGCASLENDLIVDPFNGSGTTGEAAIRLGRRYLGIEKSPEFSRLARLRLSAATRGSDGQAT